MKHSRRRGPRPNPSHAPKALARRLAALPDSLTTQPQVQACIEFLEKERAERSAWRRRRGLYAAMVLEVIQEAVKVLASPWADCAAVIQPVEEAAARFYLNEVFALAMPGEQVAERRRARGRNVKTIGLGDLVPMPEGVGAIYSAWYERSAYSPKKYETPPGSRHVPGSKNDHRNPLEYGFGLPSMPADSPKARAYLAWCRHLTEFRRWRHSLAALALLIAGRKALAGSPYFASIGSVSASFGGPPLLVSDWPPPWRPVLVSLTRAVLTAAPPVLAPVLAGEGSRARFTLAA